VLNKVALSVQLNVKADLRAIYGAPARAAAETAIDVFADKYGAKYDKAVACLTKNWEALLAFFDFPAEHWRGHQTRSKPVRDCASSNRADKGSLVGKDRQAHGIQTRQRRCENMATIEGRKSVAQSRPSCLSLRFLNDCHSHFVPGLATMVDETPNYQVARLTPDEMRDVGIKPPRVSLES
jgi:putative transposase